MEQRARELLDSLAVRSCARVRAEVGMLSGGQRQSVAIARALLGEPKLVILDEPTAALGVAQTAQVLDLVRRLRERGLGVILISHNLADVFAVADRIVVLRLGRNAGEFPAESRHHAGRRRRDHRRARRRPDRRRGGPVSTTAPGPRPEPTDAAPAGTGAGLAAEHVGLRDAAARSPKASSARCASCSCSSSSGRSSRSPTTAS